MRVHKIHPRASRGTTPIRFGSMTVFRSQMRHGVRNERRVAKHLKALDRFAARPIDTTPRLRKKP